MSTKDGLLAGGVVAALVLSLLAFVSRTADAPEPPRPGSAPPPEVPVELERKLAAAESRARRLEDALGRIEKRLAELESRGRRETAGAAHREHAAAEADPRAAEPVGLDELRRMGIDLPALRGIRIGGGDPARKLAPVSYTHLRSPRD